jgi:23S rRNA (adenine2503-C2)-methyltransferase
MIDFIGVSLADLQAWLLQRNYPAFQAEQIFVWVYTKGVRRWDAMTNLSGALREELTKAFRLETVTLHRAAPATDGSCRLQWQLVDKGIVSSVLEPGKGGWTLMMSSQIGCPVGCAFCASGKRGFVRNLHVPELIDQFLQARYWAREHSGKEITAINFDGMGEPLKNVKALMESIQILCDGKLIGLRPKQITVCTSGLIEGIEQLLQLKLPIHLKVGLHAPNQRLRQKLVPYAKKNRIEELIAVCKRYAMQVGGAVILDYVMLGGVNDHPDQALELAHLIKNIRCHVRLVPYNHVPGFNWSAPGKKEIKAFRSVLFGSKVVNSLLEDRTAASGSGLGQLAVIQPSVVK